MVQLGDLRPMFLLNEAFPNCQGKGLGGAVRDWIHSVSIASCILFIQLNWGTLIMYLLHAQHGARHWGYKFIYNMVLVFNELIVYLTEFTCFEFLQGKGCVIVISGPQGQVQRAAVFGTLSWPPTPAPTIWTSTAIFTHAHTHLKTFVQI